MIDRPGPTMWPSILFIGLIIALLCLALLASGCSGHPPGYVGITNQESDNYFYVKKEYVTSDNATHISFSVPKTDKGVWIKYSVISR